MKIHYQSFLSKNRGFTIVELMVVVAIIGAVGGASLVTFTRNWRDVRVKAATQESHAWFDEVRSLAIQRSEPCFVELDLEDASITLLEQENSCNLAGESSDDFAAYFPRNSIRNAQDLIMCAQDLNGSDPTQIVLPCSSSQTGTLLTTFTPRGTITNGLLIKFHIDSSNTNRCLTLISPIGKIRSGRINADETCNFGTTL